MRSSGSVCVPSIICRRSSNKVNSRDSVPTKDRWFNEASHVRAFSAPVVRS